MYKKVSEKHLYVHGCLVMVITMRRAYEIRRRVSEKERGEGQTLR